VIRDLIFDLCPPWLRTGRAGRYVYNFALGLDVILTKVEQGMHLRMPTVCDPSALPHIGDDVYMRQGPAETVDEYRVTLQRAFDTWAQAGGIATILREALRQIATKPRIRFISARYTPPLVSYQPAIEDSKWDTYEADGDTSVEPTRTLVEPGNWDWDSDSEGRGAWAWHRFWVVVYSGGAHTWCQPTAWKIGDAGAPKIGDRNAWSIGFDTPSPDIQRVMDAVMQWKPERSKCASMIVSFDATHFDPDEPAGGGINPSALHGRNSKVVGRAYVPARLITDARYVQRIQ
jgi:hypothetical protein